MENKHSRADKKMGNKPKEKEKGVIIRTYL
jgi:hypothetical protein